MHTKWRQTKKNQSNLDHLNVQGCLCHCQRLLQLLIDDSELKEAMKNNIIHEQSVGPYSNFKSWFRAESFFCLSKVKVHMKILLNTRLWLYTFTFGDNTMWPKIGIIQHSIKIILHHANPCNHVLPTTSLVYIVFPYSGRLGQVYWGQVTAADTVACSC